MAKFISNDSYLQGNEQESIDCLLSNGCDIELLVPTYTPHNHNPDLVLNGQIWELKTPITSNKRTLERKIAKGSKQSENLIIDIRFVKIPEKECIKILTTSFRSSHRAKRLIIIRKSGKLAKISKKD